MGENLYSQGIFPDFSVQSKVFAFKIYIFLCQTCLQVENWQKLILCELYF